MNKIVTTATAALILAFGASAQEPILATKVSQGLANISPNAAVWKMAKPTMIHLYPQTTVTMNDKKANALNSDNSAKEGKVYALYNSKEVAFMIMWPDGSKSVQSGMKSDDYPDGFAVQLPAKYGNPDALPYIGMGSKGRPVVVHLQKAVKKVYEPNGKGDVFMQVSRDNVNAYGKDLEAFDEAVDKLAVTDYQRSFIAEGFRSTTEIKDGSETFSADMHYGNNVWKGTLTRPLKDAYLNLKGAFPVAFAAWDGEKLNRDGLKLLTGWIPVKLAGQSGGTKLVETLTEPEAGDVENGKNLVTMNGCIGCHYIPGLSAPSNMAPGLANVGGQTTHAYLKESIVDPSAVVVPGYNRNAHPSMAWYNVEDGKRVSTMPPYPLDGQSLADMIAYLKTLKAEVK